MVSGLISVLFLGFILGIKHSLEPDHVIAVSTIASNTKKWWYSSLAGVFWGIGHTLTLFVVGMIVILMKGEIPEIWSMSLEFLVGIMLVYLGITSLLVFKKHSNQHVHSQKRKWYPLLKSMIIGFIHGLAGSAAMVLLTMSTVNTIWECALYMLTFGAGTVIGMLCFTTIIGIPFVLSKNKLVIHHNFTRFTGIVSTIFGIYYMYNVW
ncbi:MAG: sulfite exporter TauE/SafE family protein [Bacillota bacterium]